jgi:hypothetical protein
MFTNYYIHSILLVILIFLHQATQLCSISTKCIIVYLMLKQVWPLSHSGPSMSVGEMMINRVKLKYLKKELLSFHFILHKCTLDCTGIESRLLQLDAGY